MKILKTKTYNDLTLKIKKLESDLKKQIDKCNTMQIDHYCTILELDQYKDRCKRKDKEIADKIQFISHLNDRVVVAESESDKKTERIFELESKLCRKGTGVKGSKKVDSSCSCETSTDDNCHSKTYVNITSQEQIKKFIWKKFECTLKVGGFEENVSGIVLLSKNGTSVLAFNSSRVGWVIDSNIIDYKIEYKQGWGVFDFEFNRCIFNLRIIL